MFDWIIFIPILIVLIVAVISFILTASATQKDGWYTYLSYTAPLPRPVTWLYWIFWACTYLIAAWSWSYFNYSQGLSSNFALINLLFVANIILNLAWVVIFFGAANLILGLVTLALNIFVVATLILTLFSEPLCWIPLAFYLLWLVYAFCLNYYLASENYIVKVDRQIIV